MYLGHKEIIQSRLMWSVNELHKVIRNSSKIIFMCLFINFIVALIVLSVMISNVLFSKSSQDYYENKEYYD